MTPYSSAPADVWQRHAPEHLPAVGAEADRGQLLLRPHRLQHRDQLAGDEREGDEGGRHDQPRHGEDDADAVVRSPEEHAVHQGRQEQQCQAGEDQAQTVVALPQQQPRPDGQQSSDQGGDDDGLTIVTKGDAEVALQPEQQHEDQAGHDRRHGERQVDQRHQQRPAGKAEAGDGPGGGDAEDHIEGDRDRRHRSA